jgi:hypothetical protein
MTDAATVPSPTPRYRLLMPGDPAPTFAQRTAFNPRYVFDTVGGRYVLLCFLGPAADPHAQAAMAAVHARPDLFNDDHACFFAVGTNAQDEREGRLRDRFPGYRTFWDTELAVSRLYGAAPAEGVATDYRRCWIVIDPMLRVQRVVPFQHDRSDIAAVLTHMANLPPVPRFAGVEVHAPITILPNVFAPDLCDRLIDIYAAEGGSESGFMKEVDGVTVEVRDGAHKRRQDVNLTDPQLIASLKGRFTRCVTPEVRKAYQFDVTRMERFIVACYADADGGHFRPHRDNTTKGTAHRRFAVSINLNEDFEGGEIGFPEYGPRTYRPPKGAALIFSCSLLHSVSMVTQGRRFAFLPFLYDEAAAKLREENNRFLGDNVSAYRAGTAEP